MTETTVTEPTSILTDRARYLIATAARAPSVHNTQPWRFRVSPAAIELYCDPRRKVQADPAGREMLVSCGAALFGLRLGVRSLGYQPVVELLPEQDRPRLLARVHLGAATPVTAAEREMIKALPHRHTHRGGFGPGPLPAGLLAGLQHDALAEGATLAIVEPGLAYERLSDIATAVLVTVGDTRVDWLHAGQALHRLLAHAASRWVFASLDTQLLEITLIRALIQQRLELPGAPQMLLQLGVVDATHPTGRRPPQALIDR